MANRIAQLDIMHVTSELYANSPLITHNNQVRTYNHPGGDDMLNRVGITAVEQEMSQL